AKATANHPAEASGSRWHQRVSWLGRLESVLARAACYAEDGLIILVSGMKCKKPLPRYPPYARKALPLSRQPNRFEHIFLGFLDAEAQARFFRVAVTAFELVRFELLRSERVRARGPPFDGGDVLAFRRAIPLGVGGKAERAVLLNVGAWLVQIIITEGMK